MEKEEILEKVNSICHDVFENEEIKLTDMSTAEDVDEWDSLSHIQLVVAIERSFNIRFKSKEIQSWKNVGEMINSISEKLS